MLSCLQVRVTRTGLVCWAEERWGCGGKALVEEERVGEGGVLSVMIEPRASGKGREFLLIASMGHGVFVA